MKNKSFLFSNSQDFALILDHQKEIPALRATRNTSKDFYKKETNGVLEDYQLAPLDRKRLFNGMEDLITGGGRKKEVCWCSLTTETVV